MKLDVLSKTLGASLDREQSLPARGGSYDRLSVPLMANIKGSRTYKKALQLASRKLFVELYSGNNETSLARQASSRNRIDAIERIIHTAAHIASYPGRHEYIAIPLSAAQYSPKGAFPDLSYRAVKSLIERLSSPSIEQQEPFVFIKPGTWNKETQEGLVTRLHILRPFMDWMAREGLVFPNHPYGLRSSGERPKKINTILRLKNPEDESVIALERPLSSSEAVLPLANERLKNLRLSIRIPDYQTYLESWDFAKRRSKLKTMSGKALYRQFNGRDGHGGRLYGHWVQYCPKTLRKHLLFNKRETTEIDFSTFQLSLMYALRGISMPEGDLYCIPGRRIQRDVWKSVLTISIGASSKHAALGGIRKKLKSMAPKLMSEAEDLFDAFWGFHSGVRDSLFVEARWQELQFHESELALEVLRKMESQSIPVIPIHDGFITEKKYQKELAQAMLDAFNEAYPNSTVRTKVEDSQ